MSLFQSIVIEKYVRELDSTQLETAWQTYSHCFLDLSKQDNIRLSKEEQYQEGFLRDLFVDVFGYTLNPNPNYNITTEFKNQTGSKKADGAILKDGHAIGVIELKGMNTTDLSKIEQQAFGYKNNQPKCRYVITSNFQKLRLYIDNAVEFIEFNLFTLTQDDFALLYLLLHRDGIMDDLPAKLKSASLSQEEAITKQLYKDYSVFKRELFNDLTTNNPSVDNLVLFQKSQKLLDRLLFIFFAEDSHLLPANFAKGIISEWEQLKSLKMTVPLYDRVKAYFGYLDKGHKDEHSEIFAYNGGLFSTDELLDSVLISDDILQTHIKILSEYDFDSEVDVNILGHIFENSLTELDEVKAQLEGTAVDKSQTKRKKDGVFYTPKYITKYIVENTVGKLCTDKKLELGINEENYYQEAVINKDGTKKKKTAKQIATEKVAFDSLNAYRDWLLQITICDPAVGSGAFLNEALNFLIAEHEYIVELETKLFGSGLAYPDIENSILENNLFGVDINEESVEIAKLSLWLRTAQPRRKLNNLNDNIQCGNSLIDDVEVAGEKAFHWQTAFPQVFAKGGFDVVIGNPPYGAKLNRNNIDYLYNNYSDAGLLAKLNDTYIAFYIVCLRNLLKKSGLMGFIAPNTWRLIESGSIFRKFLLENHEILIIRQHLEKVFTDVTVDCDTVVIRNSKPKLDFNIDLIVTEVQQEITNHTISNELLLSQNFVNLHLKEEHYCLKRKIESLSQPVSNVLDIKNGVKPYEKGKGTPPQDSEIMKDKPFTSNTKLNNDFSPLIGGSSFHRYVVLWDDDYFIKYGNWLAAPRDPKIFSAPEKLIFRQTGDSLIGTYVNNKYIMRDNTHIILPKSEDVDLKFSLGILNSKLSNFLYWTINPEKGEALAQIKLFHLGMMRIPIANASQQEKIKMKVDNILDLFEKNNKSRTSFFKYFISVYKNENPSRKLKNWYELSFADFIKELTKATNATNKIRTKEGQSPIAELTKTDEFEWMEIFESKKQKVLDLQEQIQQTEREIDQMVYQLYDLTADEIAIIEAS